MKVILENEKGRAVCERCGQIVATTFLRRDVPFSDGVGLARNILAGVCDSCGGVVAIPAQSTAAIRRARGEAMGSLEANLPAVYVDLLDCAVHVVDDRASTDFRRVLLTYFLHKAARDAQAPRRLKKAYMQASEKYPELRGGARRRLSMKLGASLMDDLQNLQQLTALSRTDLLKSLVFEIQEVLLEKPDRLVLDDLRTLSAIAA